MLKTWHKIALSALAILVAGFALSYLFPAGYQVCGAPDSNHHQDCGTYHLGPAILAWIVSYADQHSGLVTAAATIVIAVFTAILSKVSINQGRFAERALKINRQPFVFVEDFRPFFDIDSAARQPRDASKPRIVSGWAFRPIIRNGGETQTRNCVVHVDYEFRESPLPVGHKFPDNHIATMPLPLGPKSIGTGGSPRTFTVEEVERIKKAERFLYMWGWVRYGDAFDPSQHRISRWCVQVVVVRDPSLTDCTFQWLVHAEGNCSDDECVVMGLG